MTRWELGQVLASNGWSLVVVSDRQKKKVLPARKGGPRHWFSGVSSSIHKSYLLCLIRFHLGGLSGEFREINHFRFAVYYADILAGRTPAEKKPKRRRSDIFTNG